MEEMFPRLVFITGQYGSGKDTHEQTIANMFGIKNIIGMSTLLSPNPDAKKYIDQGLLVPDDLVFAMLEKINLKNTCINGFPRTIEQSLYILSHFREKFNVSIVVLDIDPDEALRRMSLRITCDHCKKSFSMESNKIADLCPVCGIGYLVKRADDEIGKIKGRIDSFAEKTVPAIKQLPKDAVYYFEIPSEFSKKQTKELLEKTLVSVQKTNV